jgi:hypothetical protein
MKFTLEIDLDNAAFFSRDEDLRDAQELVRLIRQTASRFDDRLLVGTEQGKLRDINGNTCGHWQITEEK